MITHYNDYFHNVFAFNLDAITKLNLYYLDVKHRNELHQKLCNDAQNQKLVPMLVNFALIFFNLPTVECKYIRYF